ncbi:MAG: threonine/serine exporter family protein [Spirochaetales bacterium]|nr:threonine/serine exporter family protein [Spirochaetales bacterium]MBP7263646.1 threonine/serine exporter family protein [Spirochaetia bacterium]
MTEALAQLAWALLATCGFGLLFRAPLRDLPVAALGGALAWGAFLASKALTGSPNLAYFAASFAVGVYAEFMAALLKRPATLFILSAIIPLVPGGGMYYTMFHAVSGDASRAASAGFDTILAAGGIAGGLAVASAASRILWLKKPRPRTPGHGRRTT